MSAPVTILHLDSNEARLVQIALRLLRAERKRAPEYASYLSAESQDAFLRDMASDADVAKDLCGRIDAAFGIRRRFTADSANDAMAGMRLVDSLPDTPASEGVEATDCTGVITGNADLACDRQAYVEPEAPAPLPIYPLPGASQ